MKKHKPKPKKDPNISPRNKNKLRKNNFSVLPKVHNPLNIPDDYSGPLPKPLNYTNPTLDFDLHLSPKYAHYFIQLRDFLKLNAPHLHITHQFVFESILDLFIESSNLPLASIDNINV